MEGSPYLRALRYPIVALCLGAMISSATAGGFTRGCAARDRQLLMLVEARESAKVISRQKLEDAILTILHARLVCHEGRVVDALAIYDRLAENLGSDVERSSPM